MSAVRHAYEARQHAKQVLRALQGNPNSPISTRIGRVSDVADSVHRLVLIAPDRGRQSVVFWHGKWLSYAQVREVQAYVHRAIQRLAQVPSGNQRREEQAQWK